MPSQQKRLEDSLESLTELAKPSQRVGYLGIVLSGQYRISDPLDSRYFYVRFEEEGTYIRVLHRGLVAPIPDLPVRIEFSVYDNADVIAGVANEYISSFAGQSYAGSLSVGPHTHERGSSMSFPIDLRLISPFQLRPYSGMSVKITSGYYADGASVKAFTESVIDLAPLVPSTLDQHRIAIIGLNPATGTLVSVAGTTKASNIPMTSADVASVPFDWDTHIAICATRLRSEQMALVEEDLTALQFLPRRADAYLKQASNGLLSAVESSTSGITYPALTTTQKNAIASPAEGSLVYDQTLAKMQIYSGGAWKSLGGGILVKEVDGAPSVADVSEIRVANGTLTDVGGGVVQLSAGSSLIVKEADGAPSVTGVSEIRVSNGTLTDVGGGVVSLTTGGGGGGGSSDIPVDSLIYDYVMPGSPSTDHWNGTSLSLNAWTDLSVVHTFTMPASGLATINVRGAAFVRNQNNTAAEVMFGVLVDGTTTYALGGMPGSVSQSSGNAYDINPLSGINSLTLDLAAGAHTLRFRIYIRDGGSPVAYCRPNIPTESFACQVLYHSKQQTAPLTVTTEDHEVRELIHDETLASSGSFESISIPAGYDHLEIVAQFRTTRASGYQQGVFMLFNGDTTMANYRYQELSAVSTSPAATIGDYAYISGAPTSLSETGDFSVTQVLVAGPQSTSKRKSSLVKTGLRRGGVESYVASFFHTWESTAAITSVTFRTDNHSADLLAAGSRVQIFGVKTSTVVTGVTGSVVVSGVGGDPGVCDGRLTLAPSVPADSWTGTWDFATQGMPAGWSIVTGSYIPGTGIYRQWGSGTNWSVVIQAPAGTTLTAISLVDYFNPARWIAVYGPGFYVDGTYGSSPQTFSFSGLSAAGATITITQGGSAFDFYLTSMTISGSGTSPFPAAPEAAMISTPVTTTDITGTSLFFTPYKGNKIGLWDGADWNTYSFQELTLSLSGCAANTNYDVWAYLSSGAVALDKTAWANDTTRTVLLKTVDGIYTKITDKAYRYIGTFRTTSAGTTEDSMTKRFVWNYYNRTMKELKKAAPGDYTYATSTARYANNDATQRVELVAGLIEDCVKLHNAQRNSGGNAVIIGIERNAVALTDNANQAVRNGTVEVALVANYSSYPVAGFNYFARVEWASGTVTFTQSNGSGMQGVWTC